ncbi:MAG: response regulator [Candidatus Omnitrophota bacterium]|jgi:two-component system phosphate regulon response regulator PhoB
MWRGKIKVLIIDDEKDFAYFVKLNLESGGYYKVVLAHDGSAGLRLAKWTKPDIILLDIMMAGISGFEVLEKLKADKGTMSIPVLMLTARNDEDSKEKASGLYDDDYIVKPVAKDMLKLKIEKVLSRHSALKV